MLERVRGEVADSDAAEWVGRAGWLARAAVYLSMALIVGQVAIAHGNGGRKADQKGALQAVAEQPFGGFLLAVLALGFVAFAIGRIVELITIDEDGANLWAKAASRTFSAASQLALAVLAARMLVSGSESGSGGGPTAKVLEWPGGPILVGCIGLGVAAAGIGYAVQGVSRRFLRRLEDIEMSRGEKRAAEVLGIAGLTCRGVAFLLAGLFIFDAARDYDPAKTSGLDAALRTLAGNGWGPPLLLAIAAGLVCFAAYCGFMARYREVTP